MHAQPAATTNPAHNRMSTPLPPPPPHTHKQRMLGTCYIKYPSSSCSQSSADVDLALWRTHPSSLLNRQDRHHSQVSCCLIPLSRDHAVLVDSALALHLQPHNSPRAHLAAHSMRCLHPAALPPLPSSAAGTRLRVPAAPHAPCPQHVPVLPVLCETPCSRCSEPCCCCCCCCCCCADCPATSLARWQHLTGCPSSCGRGPAGTAARR